MNLLIANGVFVKDDINIHFTSSTSVSFKFHSNLTVDVSKYKYISSIKIKCDTPIRHIHLNFIPFHQEIDLGEYIIDCQKFNKEVGKIHLTIEKINNLHVGEIIEAVIQISQ